MRKLVPLRTWLIGGDQQFLLTVSVFDDCSLLAKYLVDSRESADLHNVVSFIFRATSVEMVNTAYAAKIDDFRGANDFNVILQRVAAFVAF